MSSKSGVNRQKFWFQFITTPTSDTPGTTLLLHFDHKRYMFGQVAEGTQRAWIQRGVGFKKLRHIFMTGETNWQSTGGLIGMVLTIADVQSGEVETEGSQQRPRLHIHGGPRLMHSIACARRFVFRTGMPLTVHEASEQRRDLVDEPSWQDENIKVWELPLRFSASTNSSDSKDEMSSDTEDGRQATNVFDPEQIRQDQRLRQSAVENMFDSAWRRDRLIDIPFKEIALPATIWSRDPVTKTLASFRCNTMSDAPHVMPDAVVQVREPWPASLVGNLPPATGLPKRVAMSYIVKGYSQRGAFDPKKAKALGLRPGPSYRKLADGESVEKDDGTVITPDLVLGQSIPGRGMAIICLPSHQWIADLVQRPEWRSPNVMDGIDTFCWIMPSTLLNLPELSNFMKSFPSVQHIIACNNTSPNYLAMDSSASLAIRLSQISPNHFPIPVHNNIAEEPFPVHTSSPNSRPAERGLKLQVTPNYEIQEGEVIPPLNTAQVIKDIPPAVHTLAGLAREELCQKHEISTSPCAYDDVNIVTLGTGSAVPSNYRNVSATLLRIPGHGNYLFDCGENTLGQLKRVFAPDELRNVLRELRFVWVSHLHADHHLGTLSVAAAAATAKRGSVKDAELYIASEVGLIDFLCEHRSVTRIPGRHTTMLICEPGRITKRYQGETSDFDFPANDRALNIKKLETCRVSHCHGAQAISITFSNGFKFSYSGDCRPSQRFAEIGRGSHVLVHEATFDDGMEGDARAKKHCTTGEALGVAAHMRAQNVILTHFSQRYQKIPVMENVKIPAHIQFEEGTEGEEAGPIDGALDLVAEDVDQRLSVHIEDRPTEPGTTDATSAAQICKTNVCVAFDYMTVRLADIKDMYRFTPAIQALFDKDSSNTESGKANSEQRNQKFHRNKPSKGSSQRASSDVDGLPAGNASANGDIDGQKREELSQRQLKRAMRNAQSESRGIENEIKKLKHMTSTDAALRGQQEQVG